MAFDPTAPVLALIIEPGDEIASLRPVAANLPEAIAKVIGGNIEAVEIAGGAVLWVNEAGKNLGLPTNVLATKIAHRLNAGLYPDDTVNGIALILGEVEGPHADLVNADVPQATLGALQAAGVGFAAG